MKPQNMPLYLNCDKSFKYIGYIGDPFSEAINALATTLVSD